MKHSETWATNVLRSNAVILDTETTGMDGAAQIIQLGIIDMQGNTLFDSLLRPTVDIQPGAAAVHRMTEHHLTNSPTICDVIEQIREIMFRRKVIIYNASFDSRILRQTLEAFKLDTDWLEQVNYQCAMQIYSDHIGVRKWQKLEGGDHTALGDCLAVLKLLRRMAGTETVDAVQETLLG